MRLTWCWWGGLRFMNGEGGTESMVAANCSGRPLFRSREKFGVPEIVDRAGDQAGDDDEGISENHGHGGRGW